MAVFRIEKTRDYTVMANHHLKDKQLSLKAKGLLSQMLSLPDNWDYTLAGLSYINREKIDAIREAVRELERAGYIKRSRERDAKGRLRGSDYVIYEQPQPSDEEAAQDNGQPPMSDLPVLEKPTLDYPTLEKPTLENPTQLNIDTSNSLKNKNTHESSIHSIPFSSGEPAQAPETRRMDTRFEDMEVYREVIKDNIAYDVLLHDYPYDHDRIDEIVELLVETVCSKKKYIRVSGEDYPAEVVRSRLLKLDSEHIRFVFDCLKENTTKIRNIRQYLLATLYHAPATIGNYYSALVNHDLYGDSG